MGFDTFLVLPVFRGAFSQPDHWPFPSEALVARAEANSWFPEEYGLLALALACVGVVIPRLVCFLLSVGWTLRWPLFPRASFHSGSVPGGGPVDRAQISAY